MISKVLFHNHIMTKTEQWSITGQTRVTQLLMSRMMSALHAIEMIVISSNNSPSGQCGHFKTTINNLKELYLDELVSLQKSLKLGIKAQLRFREKNQ